MGIGLKRATPSTFSLNRNGRLRQRNILRHLFETVVQRCLAESLVGGDGFAVDASLIQADACIKDEHLQACARGMESGAVCKVGKRIFQFIGRETGGG